MYGDIRDYNAVDTCLNESKPQIIIHLAAYGFVKECYENPTMAYETNVNGTINLMTALSKLQNTKRTILIISSDKVYRNDDYETVLFKETDCLEGVDTYSCSKTCEDMIARSYYHTYFNKELTSMVTIRPSDIIGGGDHNYARVIPSILEAVKKQKQVVLRNPYEY